MTDQALRFLPEPHEYWLGARRLPSVTEILRTLGFIDTDYFTWQSRVRGRAVHIGCALVEQGGVDWSSVSATEDALGEPVAPYIHGWERFLKETGWKSAVIERPNHHRLYHYAGTPDRVGFWRDGQEGIVDIKSMKVFSKQAWWDLQLGGYDHMEPRLGEGGARRLTDVCLTVDGKYHIENCQDTSAGPMFLAAQATYQWGMAHGVYDEK